MPLPAGPAPTSLARLGLPKPVGRQREVLYLPADGHTVVLGSAGSGKTTLALLRAQFLSTHPERAGRTLLVTFNALLVAYLRATAPGLSGSVDVRHYHHFARGYLSRRGKLPRRGGIAAPDARVDLVRRALPDLARRHPAATLLRAPAESLAEEVAWIARMGVASRAEYEGLTRIARGGLRIAPADRAVMWDLVDAYRKARAAAGPLYDWDDIATAVGDEFARDASPRLYTHVVIDEGQDFSPAMLRSLVAAVPADGTVTFFGDVAQQIYGSRLSWRDAGLTLTHPVFLFQENYRNTQQIAEFALAITRGPHFRGLADMVAPNAVRAAGARPTLVELPDAGAELQLVVRQAAARATTRRVALLLRDRSLESAYTAALRAAGVQPRRLHRSTVAWDPSPGVWIGTYHNAKGLEFDAVLLPHLDAGRMPAPERILAIGDADLALSEEARLLYVAATRARSELVMTYAGAVTPVLAAVDAATYERLAAP